LGNGARGWRFGMGARRAGGKPRRRSRPPRGGGLGVASLFRAPGKGRDAGIASGGGGRGLPCPPLPRQRCERPPLYVRPHHRAAATPRGTPAPGSSAADAGRRSARAVDPAQVRTVEGPPSGPGSRPLPPRTAHAGTRLTPRCGTGRDGGGTAAGNNAMIRTAHLLLRSAVLRTLGAALTGHPQCDLFIPAQKEMRMLRKSPLLSLLATAAAACLISVAAPAAAGAATSAAPRPQASDDVSVQQTTLRYDDSRAGEFKDAVAAGAESW